MKQKIPTKITLHRHVTTGGAVYLTDNHNFAKAKIIIRLDGVTELSKCDILMKPKKKMWKIQDQSVYGDWGDIKCCDDDTDIYKDCFYETKKEALAEARQIGYPKKGYRVVPSDTPSHFDFY
jgi:hypothetical protein